MKKDGDENMKETKLTTKIIARYEELYHSEKVDCAEVDKLKSMYRELTETSTHKIARLLHSKLCRNNHIDRCNWYYETIHYGLSDNWRAWTHDKYLEKARRLEAVGFTFEDVDKFFEALDN